MIRIDRGPEPDILPPIRGQELARVAALGREPTSTELGDLYKVVRRALRKAQRFRCCYCELFLQESFHDVEHYRPKARADRQPGSDETHGYWWLAWTWQNLLFACPGCNRSSKRDRFPLDHGSRPLVAQEEPPGAEKPLVLDPANPSDSEPIVEIRFVSRTLEGELTWFPVARNESIRGRMTIDVCGLGRDELIDLYRQHVESKVAPAVADLNAEIQLGHEGRVQEAWARALRLLKPRNEFIALSYDALDLLVPVEVRHAWGLVLPSSLPL